MPTDRDLPGFYPSVEFHHRWNRTALGPDTCYQAGTLAFLKTRYCVHLASLTYVGMIRAIAIHWELDYLEQ